MQQGCEPLMASGPSEVFFVMHALSYAEGDYRLSRVLALRSTDWRSGVGCLALGYINIYINFSHSVVLYLVALGAG